MISILIADDQALMTDGLKTIIELEEDMKVVATAVNGREAYELACRYKPDVILMDIRMPVMDGVESTRLIKRQSPETNIIMLTTFNDEDYIIQALSYGANGYLLKDIKADKLLEIIRDSVTGNLYIPASVAAKLTVGLSALSTMPKQPRAGIEELSEREKEIAGLLVKGMTNRQIASTLYLSEGTVKNYISEIYSKIGLNDRTKAMAKLSEYMEGFNITNNSCCKGGD
jgi:DNA-binding NarL/FixJ family response regulator